MGSLNKFELNKLIVSMRHNVKRAKVQTVNKLTRQVKQLKNKKALDELKKKNESKAERLVNEVLIMKKIPPDEVSAFTLCNTKKVDDILCDTESSLRLKALAKLSNHKSLTPIVKQFRTRYPSWETEFPKVLIALKKREKLKSAKKETKKDNNNDVELSDDDMSDLSSEDKEASDQENVLRLPKKRKSNSNLKSINTLPEGCKIVSTRGNRFSVSSDDFEIKNSVGTQEYSINYDKPSSESDDEKLVKVTKNIKPNLAVKKMQNKGETRQVENNPHTDKTFKKTMDSFLLSTDNKPHKTIDHSANKNKKIHHDNINENDDSDVEDTYASSESDDEKSVKVTKNIKPNLAVKKTQNKGETRLVENNPHINQTIKKTTDSFFLSTDNKPHKTIDHSANKKKKIHHDDINENDDSDIEENSERSKPRQFNSTRGNGFNKNSKVNRTFKPKNNSNIFSKSKGVDFGNKRNENRSKAHVANNSQEKLHPSWAAKKKMVTIANFEGKKVTFD